MRKILRQPPGKSPRRITDNTLVVTAGVGTVPDHSNDRKVYDSLRMPERDQLDLLKQFNGSVRPVRTGDNRNVERIQYTRRGVTVSIDMPGGTSTAYLVRPRNLSRSGMAFLHGTYCYTDVRCRILMQTVDGEPVVVTGTIVRCQHHSGAVHDVGVRFDEPIDVHEFAEQTYAEANSNEEPSKRVMQLTGSVLYVDDSADDRALLSYLCRLIGIELKCASTAEQAIEFYQQTDPQLILTDFHMPGMNGKELGEKFRELGYRSAIIAVTAETDREIQQEILASGIDRVIVKPYRHESMQEILGQYLPRDLSADSSLSPIVSEQWNDREMRPTITQFLERLADRITDMHRQINERELDSLRDTVRDIRGTSGGFGFPQISETAKSVIERIKDTEDPNEVRAILDELIAMCSAACVVVRRKQ